MNGNGFLARVRSRSRKSGMDGSLQVAGREDAGRVLKFECVESFVILL
jgi:hypothetical protein